jgi:hypothetical protein
VITVGDVSVGAGARTCLPAVLPAGVRRVAVVAVGGGIVSLLEVFGVGK